MADIILKNKQGEEVILRNKTKLTAENTSGGTEEFIQPSGSQTISANGTYDIKNKASVAVAVPNPSTGTMEITANGTYDVTEKASAHVVVPNPSTGKKTITDMSEVDVTDFAKAQVVDANLIAENIKKDVTILGTTGTYEGGGSSGPTNYVTFTAAQANSSVKLTVTSSIPGFTIFYSRDNSNWLPYTINTVINLSAIGDYVSFYGVGNWRCTFDYSTKYLKFVMTGKIAGSGDCNALIDSEADGVVAYCFYRLFYGCTSLITAPDLPATTLASYCYREMFYNCNSLVTAPELPATTLATGCYNSMFNWCTSLVTAPELPATTLVSSCYNSMFNHCNSLVTAPELPATTLVSSCYNSMFDGCTSLVTAPELPATALESGCYSYMFNNCKSLTSVKTAVTSWDTSYTGNWLSGTAASGTVYCPAASTIPTGNNAGIPSGWTRENWPAA